MTSKRDPIDWAFKRRFRQRAFGRGGSRLAAQRLREAVAEIAAGAGKCPTLAADAAVCLLERLWPTFELIDTSSGSLTAAVGRAVEELVQLVTRAPVNRKKRNGWLRRLWRAIQNDNVGYLTPVEERWGELCGDACLASRWSDTLLPVLRSAWSDWRPGAYVKGTDLCLSGLLAAGRYQELMDVLALKRHPVWPWRRYGIRALAAQGLYDEALAYAEASRGLNIPNAAVDAECETILLLAGRREQAYRLYALNASQSDAEVIAFQKITRKYPEVDPRHVLTDLAKWSCDVGKWFSVAKNKGYLDMALEFAETGQTDPKALVRAARKYVRSNPRFAYSVGRRAVERVLAEEKCKVSGPDLLSACDSFLGAANKLGTLATAKRALVYLLSKYPKAPGLFRGLVSRRLEEV